MADRKSLSVVFSFRNEEAVLDELLRRLRGVLEATPYDYELIFVNDASTDRSLEILLNARERDPRIKIITMSNRFGVNPCFLAGIRHATGDAVITMDTDLQDPPEIIPHLLAEWEQGADVVHATRTAREGESWFKMGVTKWAYRVLHAVSEIELPVDTGMFKLMSRRVAERIAATQERDPFLRGLIAWAGFRQARVLYRREARHAGPTHFPLLSKGPASEFLSGLVSFSVAPLYGIVAVGVVATGITLLVFLVAIAQFLFAGGTSGMFVAVCGLALLAAIQLIATGLLGLYLARIFKQVTHRPDYVIADLVGFSESNRASK